MTTIDRGLWYEDAAFGEARIHALRTGQYQDPCDDVPSLSEVADAGPLPPCSSPCGWCTSQRPCPARRDGEARALERAS